MSVLGGNGVYDAVAGAYRYGVSKEGNRTQRTVAGGTSFAEQIQKTGDTAGKTYVKTFFMERNVAPH